MGMVAMSIVNEDGDLDIGDWRIGLLLPAVVLAFVAPAFNAFTDSTVADRNLALLPVLSDVHVADELESRLLVICRVATRLV